MRVSIVITCHPNDRLLHAKLDILICTDLFFKEPNRRPYNVRIDY